MANLSMFNRIEKIKYILGRSLPIKLVREWLQYDFLFSEKSFMYNNRQYKPKRLASNLFLFETLVNEKKIKSFIRKNSSDHRVFEQTRMFEEIYQIRFEPNEFVIDAGANIGLTSIILSKHHPHIQIIAIEPDKKNYELLLQNVRNNNCSNITCINKALWINCGTILIGNSFRDGTSWSISVVDAEIAEQKEMVEAITLHDLMNNFDMNNIGFFKIDIEGAEKELLNNKEFQKVLKSKCKRLAIEVHEEVISTECAINLLTQLDFKIHQSGEHVHATNLMLNQTGVSQSSFQ